MRKYIPHIALGAFTLLLGIVLFNSNAYSKIIPVSSECVVVTGGVSEWKENERQTAMKALKNGVLSKDDYLVFVDNPKVVEGREVPEKVPAVAYIVDDDGKINVLVVTVELEENDRFPPGSLLSCFSLRESTPIVEGGKQTVFALSPERESSN